MLALFVGVGNLSIVIIYKKKSEPANIGQLPKWIIWPPLFLLSVFRAEQKSCSLNICQMH